MFEIMINHLLKRDENWSDKKNLTCTIWKSDSNFDFIERETVFEPRDGALN